MVPVKVVVELTVELLVVKAAAVVMGLLMLDGTGVRVTVDEFKFTRTLLVTEYVVMIRLGAEALVCGL